MSSRLLLLLPLPPPPLLLLDLRSPLDYVDEDVLGVLFLNAFV